MRILGRGTIRVQRTRVRGRDECGIVDHGIACRVGSMLLIHLMFGRPEKYRSRSSRTIGKRVSLSFSSAERDTSGPPNGSDEQRPTRAQRKELKMAFPQEEKRSMSLADRDNPYSFDAFLEVLNSFDFYLDNPFLQRTVKHFVGEEWRVLHGKLQEFSSKVSFRWKDLADHAGRRRLCP